MANLKNVSSVLRIGTRASELALWQAEQVLEALRVQIELANLPINLQLVPILSAGDQDRDSSLERFSVPGVFTKALDQALLDNKIDLAVHSMKDLPTILLDGIELACVLKRGYYDDVLVYNHRHKSKDAPDFQVATGSVRRRSQWLYRYPTHQIQALRGNVHTRLEKLYASSWDGIILSLAGIECLGIKNLEMEILDWITPAPAQGVIAVTMRQDRDSYLHRLLHLIHHQATAYAVTQERDFLQALGSGCSLPLGALTTVYEEQWLFQATVILGDTLVQIRKLGQGNLGKEAATQLKRDMPNIEQRL